MGDIISYIQYINGRNKMRERDNVMYEALVKEQKTKPANKYTVNDAVNLADRVLCIGGYDKQGGSTPIVKIAKQFGFTTYQEDNLPEDISGNIFVGGTTESIYGTSYAIIVGKYEEFFHQRFIVAHELGHYLIDYLGSEDSSDMDILFSRTYPKISHHSSEEIRADRFAAELLMPTKTFCKQYLKSMERYDYNKRYVVAYLSKYFETKKSSIEKRIQEITL